MKQNPLCHLAFPDKHKTSGGFWTCRACGANASTYNAGHALIAQRPDAGEKDYFVACDNADCENSAGVDIYDQNDEPSWVEVHYRK